MGIALCGGCLHAATAWSIPAGAHDKDGDLAGYVNFYLSDCVTGPAASCSLNIAITNTEVNPKAAGQLISGLSFQLLNAGTALPATGTLSDAINNNSNGDGTGGAVTVIDGNSTTTTTTRPERWELSQDGNAFKLNTLTGGSPEYMIMAAGSTDNANPSITNRATLMGTVDFQITGITGLTASTVLNSVTFFFGTGPDAHTGGICTSGCGPITTTGAEPAPTPEPFSLALAGGGLLAVVILRRRLA
jgi:hypothetical protein